MAGRVAILAGSENFSGAAVLAATGALRGGGGLITLFVSASARPPIAAKCPPEIIIREFSDPRELLEFPFDSLVLGCGLGKMTATMAEGLLDLISNRNLKMGVDLFLWVEGTIVTHLFMLMPIIIAVWDYTLEWINTQDIFIRITQLLINQLDQKINTESTNE